MNAPCPSDPVVWRTAGGDNARRGRFPRRVGLGRRARRRFEAQGAVQASVVFDEAGMAFVADMAGGVQSFDRAGKRRWRILLGGGISATPVVDPTDLVLFVATHTGELVALDATTGATRWRRLMPTRKDPRILSDLLQLPRSNRIVLSSWSGRFFALDAATGEPRFDWDAGISPRSAASADQDGNLYIVRALAGRGTELVRVRVSGEETVLHREPEDSRGAARALVAAAPSLDEERGTLFLVVNRERMGQLIAWSLERESVVWKRELNAAVQGTPTILAEGTVIVGDLAGQLRGFAPDGTRRFDCALFCDYLLAGGVSPGGDRFAIGDPLGTVHELDAQGSRRAIFEAPRSIQARPSFDPYGHLYVPCTDRWVYRIDAGVSTG